MKTKKNTLAKIENLKYLREKIENTIRYTHYDDAKVASMLSNNYADGFAYFDVYGIPELKSYIGMLVDLNTGLIFKCSNIDADFDSNAMWCIDDCSELISDLNKACDKVNIAFSNEAGDIISRKITCVCGNKDDSTDNRGYMTASFIREVPLDYSMYGHESVKYDSFGTPVGIEMNIYIHQIVAMVSDIILCKLDSNRHSMLDMVEDDELVVNHTNACKLDNRSVNLEITSTSLNIMHGRVLTNLLSGTVDSRIIHEMKNKSNTFKYLGRGISAYDIEEYSNKNDEFNRQLHTFNTYRQCIIDREQLVKLLSWVVLNKKVR